MKKIKDKTYTKDELFSKIVQARDEEQHRIMVILEYILNKNSIKHGNDRNGHLAGTVNDIEELYEMLAEY